MASLAKVQRQQSRSSQWCQCSQKKWVITLWEITVEVSPGLLNTLHFSCCPDACFHWFSFGINHLSGKDKASEVKEWFHIDPWKENKIVNTNLKWEEKVVFPKRFVVKRTFETVIYNNSIIMDFGMYFVLKLIHLKNQVVEIK